MSKAILEFDLSDDQDYLDFKIVNKAHSMHSALFEIFYNTKKGLEWSFDGKEIDKYEALDMVYERLNEILKQNDINLDVLN